LAVKLNGLLKLSNTLRAEIENACDVAKQTAEVSAAFNSVLRMLDLNFEQDAYAGGPGRARQF
jgi:hypothetical protein